MTEQPFNPVTEQEYLGNRRPAKPTTGPVPHVNFLTDSEPAGGRAAQQIAYEMAAHSYAVPPKMGLTVVPKTDLLLEAEVHTTHALTALQANELDAGIAWLQSALAFAQNHRHAEQLGGDAA